MLFRVVLIIYFGLISAGGALAAKDWKKSKDKPVPATAQGFDCANSRKYCKHMKSCAEACFYLTQCHTGRLDRDKDGIPCENVYSKVCGR